MGSHSGSAGQRTDPNSSPVMYVYRYLRLNLDYSTSRQAQELPKLQGTIRVQFHFGLFVDSSVSLSIIPVIQLDC